MNVKIYLLLSAWLLFVKEIFLWSFQCQEWFWILCIVLRPSDFLSDHLKSTIKPINIILIYNIIVTTRTVRRLDTSSLYHRHVRSPSLSIKIYYWHPPTVGYHVCPNFLELEKSKGISTNLLNKLTELKLSQTQIRTWCEKLKATTFLGNH